MPDIIPTRQSRLWPSRRLLAQRVGDEIVGPAIVRLAGPTGDQNFSRTAFHQSMVRLLPSLKPLLWHSLSEAALQSGAPLADTGQIMRPVTIEDGLVIRDRVAPASLARALRSSMVSDGLFRVDQGFWSILPISLSRPGLSGRSAGGAAGSPDCGAGGSAAAGADGGAACGRAAPQIVSIHIATAMAATWVRVSSRNFPGRSGMESNVARSRHPAKPFAAIFRAFGRRRQSRAPGRRLPATPTAPDVSRSGSGSIRRSG